MSDIEPISRPQMYFELCQVLRKRSTCRRGKVGCIAVVDKRIVATGYNGAPPGMPECIILGCDVEENNHIAGCQRAVHAEANLIAFSAKHGLKLEGASLWCTHAPCRKCAQLIISAGFIGLHYLVEYRLPDGLELLDQANIPTKQWDFT